MALNHPYTPRREPAVALLRLVQSDRVSATRIKPLRTRTARDVGESDASISTRIKCCSRCRSLDYVRSPIDNRSARGVGVVRPPVKYLPPSFAEVPDSYLPARARRCACRGDQLRRAMLGHRRNLDRSNGGWWRADLTRQKKPPNLTHPWLRGAAGGFGHSTRPPM